MLRPDRVMSLAAVDGQMDEHIILVDVSEVGDGSLAELRLRIRELADFVGASGTRASSYNFYLSRDERLMTVVQAHPDSASVEAQMAAAAPIFAKFAPLLRMISMDVYGRPSETLLETLKRKAELMGLAEGPRLHRHAAGFFRR